MNEFFFHTGDALIKYTIYSGVPVSAMAVAAMMRENPSAKRIVKRKLVDRECIVDLGAFYILVIDQLDVDKVIDLNAKASGPAMIKSICHYARYNVLQLFFAGLTKNISSGDPENANIFRIISFPGTRLKIQT